MKRRADMPRIDGIGHITLTVTDVKRSAAWYADVFGVSSVARESEDGYEVDVLAGEGLLVGLRRQASTGSDDRFDEGRVGLDHIALLCPDAGALEEWHGHLDRLGVPHSGIVTSPFGSHLNFKDPDGIALEVFVPA
jgi:glyoxylase I family protein